MPLTVSFIRSVLEENMEILVHTSGVVSIFSGRPLAGLGEGFCDVKSALPKPKAR